MLEEPVDREGQEPNAEDPRRSRSAMEMAVANRFISRSTKVRGSNASSSAQTVSRKPSAGARHLQPLEQAVEATILAAERDQERNPSRRALEGFVMERYAVIENLEGHTR